MVNKAERNNIILIGFMGVGKTSIGRHLADRNSMNFIDTDQTIEEEEQQKIAAIFTEFGEAYFRQLETKLILRMLKDIDNTVMAVGGGLPVEPQNREPLKQLGVVVYLEAEKGTILKRLHNDKKRPLLQGGYMEEKIESLMQQRAHIYEEMCDYVVKIDNKNFDVLINEINEKCGIDRR